MNDDVRIVPANEAAWAEIETVFRQPGDPRRCWCQWFHTETNAWSDQTVEGRAALLREQTRAEEAGAEATTGLVAYVAGEPAGWCAVEPRAAYERLPRSRTVWKGRAEDKADPGVWSIVCFVVRPEFRGRGLMRRLAEAAVEHAWARGATAIEAYPLVPDDGERADSGSAYVGTRDVFKAAGFAEVSRPSANRAVMRLDR